MDYCISIGPAVVKLQDFFYTTSFFQMWKWKLDTFYIDPENSLLEYSKCIEIYRNKDRSTYSLLPEDGYIIQNTIKSAFFNQQFISSPDGTYYCYYRHRKNENTVLLHANKNWKKITILEDHTDTAGHMAFEYLTHVIPHALLHNYNVLTFHGVLMEYNGAGIIISANSGVGKTTHARLWKKVKNSFIINGDKSACYKKDGVWTGFGMPWCGTSGEYMNREVPIKAIVVLERSEENHAQKMKTFDGFRRIMEHALYPKWDEDMTNRAMDLLDDFVGEVPVYRLQCRPDEESVEVLYRTIFCNE